MARTYSALYWFGKFWNQEFRLIHFSRITWYEWWFRTNRRQQETPWQWKLGHWLIFACRSQPNMTYLLIQHFIWRVVRTNNRSTDENKANNCQIIRQFVMLPAKSRTHGQYRCYNGRTYRWAADPIDSIDIIYLHISFIYITRKRSSRVPYYLWIMQIQNWLPHAGRLLL